MIQSDIRGERRRLGLSQMELAEMAGCSQSMISHLERGVLEPSPALAKRIESILEQDDRSAATAQPVQDVLSLPLDLTDATVPHLAVQTWQRPDPSGDLIVVRSNSSTELTVTLIVVVDIAGSGQCLSHFSLYLRGWISGYLRQFNAVAMPSVRQIVMDLSAEIVRLSIESAAFVARIVEPNDGDVVVEIESINASFPPPILITGPPYETQITANPGPALPWSPGESSPAQTVAVAAPTLVIATDGLLQRLGNGSEVDGTRAIRKWQTSSHRRRLAQDILGTGVPVDDDELCTILRWQRWQLEETINVANDGDRHRVIRRVERGMALREPKDRSRMLQALVEALDNARIHSIGGQGITTVRLREETSGYRIEIEDDGTKQPLKKDVKHSTKGFGVMRRLVDHVQIEESDHGGTIVGLFQRRRKT